MLSAKAFNRNKGLIPLTKHVLFAGNPGAGKSTILNCLMQSYSESSLMPEEKFQSGISIGSGMTYQLDTKILNDVVYMDTPGLADTKKRKQAAAAITEALKKDGIYQVVFVVTLEAGRVRPDDVTTMTLVLQSAKEITHYGVIFNKLGKGVLRMLDDNKKMELVSQVSLEQSPDRPMPVPLFLRNYPDLEDEDDVLTDIPELGEFLRTLFPIQIHKDQVGDIPVDTYAALKEEMENMLSELREDNKKLQQKMKEDQELYQKRMDQMLQQEKEKFEEQKRDMQRHHEMVMQQMQQQLQDSREEAQRRAEQDDKRHSESMQQMQQQFKDYKNEARWRAEQDNKKHSESIQQMQQQVKDSKNEARSNADRKESEMTQMINEQKTANQENQAKIDAQNDSHNIAMENLAKDHQARLKALEKKESGCAVM